MLSHSINGNLTSFGGYDACPIRNVYMQGIRSEGLKNIYKEMKAIGEKDGFQTLYYDGIQKMSSDDDPWSLKFLPRWAQDEKTFLYKDDKESMLSSVHVYHENYVFARLLNKKIQPSKFFATGGNVFIGKKSNGDRWVLVGINEKGSEDLDEFSKLYGAKPENIHFLTQPNFHLDMAIRPIGYPYILVNDEELVKEKVKDDIKLKEKVDKYYNKFHNDHEYAPIPYMSTEGTIEELERAGFIPIRIPGVFDEDINYMNAIVNKHPDGTMTYITNSTKGSKFEGTDKIFLDELKRCVPDVKDVYFVSGGLDENSRKRNAIMYNLGELQGGIHCMTLEEPDFEAWG